jgi:uncharacterized membrane protein
VSYSLDPEKLEKTWSIRLNRIVLWLTRHWVRVMLVLVGLYAGLPWVAPTLMKIGLTGPAEIIYKMYIPMCHQFAFRSVFLYGEQAFYPREAAMTPYKPFEDYATDDPAYEAAYRYWYDALAKKTYTGSVDRADLEEFSPWMQVAAKEFKGNEQMGYKTAICARDVAIYGMVFVGLCIYSIPYVRRRLRPLPFFLYVLIGVVPIGLDGFSQLLSYEPFNLWPVRETAPFFRIATGAVFGLMSAWLAFPHMEASMRDTRRQILVKFMRAGLKTDE